MSAELLMIFVKNPVAGKVKTRPAKTMGEKRAFEIYMHRLQAGIGAMVAVLGGIDALVFTAGVGENSPEVRAATCSQLEFLGLKLDRAANAQPFPGEDVATADSQVRILVIRAQEDWAIARECWKLTHVDVAAKS